MAIINKADFARLAGVSRMAVTLGCRRGLLAAMPDGHMDTEAAENKKYLEASRRAGMVRKPAAKRASVQTERKPPEKKPDSKKPQKIKTIPAPSGTEKKPKPAPDKPKPAEAKPKIIPMPETREPPRGMAEQAMDQYINLKERKDMADIRLKNSQADRHIQARAERMGLLVLKSDVDKILAVLGADLRMRLFDMPRRITPQIVALVQSGSDAREIETLLDTEITDAVKHAKETAHRAGVKEF